MSVDPAGRLATCVDTFREWLHMPDPGALYVTIATVAANRAPGDPVWLLLVGPPGSGKTEVLNSIVGQPDVHPAATLTEGALLSGVPKKDVAAGAKGGLLREIGDFGILLHKDFTSVLSMNRDARAAVLAAFREIYDGAWTRHVGTDGGRALSWTGKLALIAGVTPTIDSHHAVIGSMGERFVMYRMPRTDAEEQMRRALGHVGREPLMRRALASAVGEVLGSVGDEVPLREPDATTRKRLTSIVTLAVRCRSAVERDPYGREITMIPEPEAPARLGLVLLRLLNGLRAIGVDNATAWRVVTKCALDSMPAVRRTVLECLMARDDWASASEISKGVPYPMTTTRRVLEDLAAHGVIEREAQERGGPDRWAVTTWARMRWPAIPEMLEDADQRQAAVPEMSAGTSFVQGVDARVVPTCLPLSSDDDKSGTPDSTGASMVRP